MNNGINDVQFVRHVRQILDRPSVVYWQVEIKVAFDRERSPLLVKHVEVEVSLQGKLITFSGRTYLKVLNALEEFFNKDKDKKPKRR